MENNLFAANTSKAAEILAGFVSLPAIDPEATVKMDSIDMYAENLDDYGESLNSNAGDMIKYRGGVKQ